ncbi:Galactose mutarotase [Lachnospiraceae bacterium]|nr:Galactose mutarotase [Lachnospiraceae bacterium]
MRVIIKNDVIKAEIDTFGAELKSVVKDGKEYMWNADPAYWKRTSPVLFPFVGGVVDSKYTFENKTYPMSQHGFARDMEFEVLSQEETKASFILKSTDETLAKYPFPFELVLSYSLDGNRLKLGWEVKNTGDRTMPFAIGAHPAFNIIVAEDGTMTGNYLKFDTKKQMVVRKFADGLVQNGTYLVQPDEDGCLALDGHTFDNGVLIMENDQAHSVALADSNKKPYVTLEFDAPLFGIWSPEKKNAPFVCLEPWYGRADAADFTGDLTEREFEQSVEAKGTKDYSYTMIFD